MQYRWRRVEHPAQTVPAEIAHHGEALFLDEHLDGVAQVAEGDAGPHDLDPAHQRIVGHVHQPASLHADAADRVHAAGVAVPAVEDHRHVDVEDVALDQAAVEVGRANV